jgi:uncharacterized protein
VSARRAEARRDDPIPQSLFTVRPRRATPRWWTRVTAVLLALALAVLAHAQEPGHAPSVPEPVGFVNDHAGKLDESTRAKLEAFLDQLKQKTGAEFAVLIVPTTAPMSPSEYKVEVFRRWGLGRKGEDDGLLMLVALEEREVRFETGYGLEGTLPDGLQSRIFRNEMAPRFREGDWAGGVTAGVLACAARIAAEKGVTLEWDGRELRYRAAERGLPPMVIGLIIAIVVLFVVMRLIGGGGGGGGRRRRRGWYLGPGSFGGFGGGFGGGSFGGGGFGGGSFGGFGGGASGGGGGGGRW